MLIVKLTSHKGSYLNKGLSVFPELKNRNMIYRLRIGQPKLEAWGGTIPPERPNMAKVGIFYSDGNCLPKAIEFSSFEAAKAIYSEFWNYEVVYQDSNGEWKSVNSIPENSGVPMNDHICPSCGNAKCSKQEIKCWRCGNKLR